VGAYDGVSTVHVMFLFEKCTNHPVHGNNRYLLAKKFGHAALAWFATERGHDRDRRDKVIGRIRIAATAPVTTPPANVKDDKSRRFSGLDMLVARLQTPDEHINQSILDFVALRPWLHGNQAARATATSALARGD